MEENIQKKGKFIQKIAIYMPLSSWKRHRWGIKFEEGGSIMEPPSSDRKG
jgi:hypothetical protein